MNLIHAFISDIKIVEVENTSIEKVNEFDRNVLGLNRAAFLDYLIKNTKIFVAENENDEAVDGKTIEGYIATKNDRICALYANSVSIAHSLMRKFLHTTKFSEITFCTKNECWDIERNPSTVSKRIHRRHTRAVPSTIKWDRVYAVNVGVHII